MRSPKMMETWGAIQKGERLKTVRLEGADNVLVFQSVNPFPGYFENSQFGGTRPHSMYLVAAKKYNAEDLALSLKNVGRKMFQHCSGDFGFIEMKSEKYYCIRYNNSSCLKKIDLLLSYLEEEGIEFRNYRPIEDDAVIKIYKNLSLRELNEYLYEDILDVDKFYVKLPYHLSWNDFKQITTRVKMNMSNHFFDAAQAIIWNSDGPTDLVRIFDRNSNRIRLKIIYELYVKESKLWVKDNFVLEQSQVDENSPDKMEMYY